MIMPLNRTKKYSQYYTTKYKAQIMSNVIQELVSHCVSIKNKEDQLTLVKTQGILNDYMKLLKEVEIKTRNDRLHKHTGV
tara:strand:- start:1 stop:240 length:240 start_codon:yes stop_codon:yes gene_type:complete